MPGCLTPSELRGETGQLAECREPRERLALELADALARQVELVADRLERPRLALEAEPQLEDAPLALGERVERPANVLAAERLLGLVERIGGLAVGEQVAELSLVVRADRLVQRDRRGGSRERLLDVLDREPGGLGQLFLRRLAAELDLEPARRPRQLLLALDDVHRHADRARVVRNGALHALADPPRGVGRELVAAAPIELLDRTVQAERPLLDQVEERNAETAVALRDRDDQTQVGLDHATLGAAVATLDRLREHNLLVGRQQLVLSDVREEQLQAVARPARGVGLVHDRLGLRSLFALLEDRLAHLQTDALQFLHDVFLTRVVQVVLHRERLELRRFDPAALLARLDQRARALGLQQVAQLALRQLGIDVLSFCTAPPKPLPNPSYRAAQGTVHSNARRTLPIPAGRTDYGPIRRRNVGRLCYAFFRGVRRFGVAGPRSRRAWISSTARSGVIDSTESPARRLAFVSPSGTYGPKRPPFSTIGFPLARASPRSLRGGAGGRRPPRLRPGGLGGGP